MATASLLAPLLRQSVGFDRINDFFESALHSANSPCYPPHNIERYGDDHYRIVIAAAGLSVADLDLRVERGVLIVCASEHLADPGATYLYQGIAHGAFRMVFHLADHIEVQGATFENGLLMIFLLHVAPDPAKTRHIRVSTPGDDSNRRPLDRH